MTDNETGLEDRHIEAYLEMSRDQLIYLAAKRYGDVSEHVDLDNEELARDLAFDDVLGDDTVTHPGNRESRPETETVADPMTGTIRHETGHR